MASPTTALSARRQLAMWLAPALLVPLLMVGAIKVSAPKEVGGELRDLHPLEVGTTWVYDVFDHGEPSGTRTRQIDGQAGLGDDLLDLVTLTSHYTDYPTVGALDSLVYLGATDHAILQYGIYSSHEYRVVDPPAPSYELPVEEGASWSYKGKVGDAELTFEATLVAIEDVEVSGRTFNDCAHYVTELEYVFPGGGGEPETLEEWTCPEYGPVKTIDVIPNLGVEITEELTGFHGRGINWTARDRSASPGVTGAGATFGFDAARTNHIDGTLDPTLAWSDSRSLNYTFPMVSDGEVGVLGEEDGSVSAVDTSSGEMQWRVRLSGPITAPITIAGDTALVADASKNLWALDLADGSAAWVRAFDDVITQSPVAVGKGVVVASEDGSLRSLSLADGSEVWSREIEGLVRTAPAAADNTVIVAGSESIAAFDAADGTTLWGDGLEGPTTAGPLISDGHVVVADDAGIVSTFDLDDGTRGWQARLNLSTEHMAAGDNKIVVLTGTDRLTAFDLDSGATDWALDIEASSSAPVVVGGEVVSVSTDGTVTTVAVADGSTTGGWDLPTPADDVSLSADLPIGTVDGTIVISAFVGAEAHAITQFAYPVASDAARRGVSFGSDVRAIPSPSNAAAALKGDVLFVPGQDNVLYRSTSTTDVAPVLQSTGLQPGVVIAGDLLIAQRDQEIQALPVDGGKPIWTFPAAEPYPGSVPAVSGGTVFVPEYGLGLAAVDLADGTPLWFEQIDNAIGTMPPLPIPGGDVIYGSGSIARYDGASGRRVWSIPDTQMFNSAAYLDGLVFADLVRNEHSSGLAAIDATSGRIEWFRDNQNSQIIVGPVASDGVVIYPDAGGLVVALDADSGVELWQMRLSTPIAGTPVIADGRVYIAETGREEDLYQREFRVSAHDLRTGEFLGSFQPPGQGYLITPALSGTEDGKILVPSTNRFGSIVMILEPRS